MRRDDYDFLVLLNQAQLVMIDEEALLPKDMVTRIAAGIELVVQQENQPSAERPANYLIFEKKMIAAIGADATNLHMGRSRNDIGATRERLWMRQEFMDIMDRLIAARELLLGLAEENTETIIPAFTHAVQAQPISLAHYLLSLASSLERDTERLLGVYQRINHSPLGSGALATSGFALNRIRLMELLGFTELCLNSYDCIGVASADSKAEFAGVLSVCALNLGRFSQDLVIQHADPMPGITLGDKLVGGSSIMPQKRNPGALEALRSITSSVIADAHAVTMICHNTPYGDVADVRGNALNRVLTVTDEAKDMLDVLTKIFEGFLVAPELCKARVEKDYSTMTEFADMLLREAGVAFRTGHKVAAELAKYGRSLGKTPGEIGYGEVAGLYEQVTGEKLPLTEEQVRKAIDPLFFVASRKGAGGPQQPEVERMIGLHRIKLVQTKQWHAMENERLLAAERQLQQEFAKRLTTGA